MHFALGPYAAASFAVGFAAYSEMLPQSTAVAFILEEVAAKWYLDGVSFDDGVVAGQVLNVVSFFLGQLRVAHGKLSCRKGHTAASRTFSVMESLPFKSESAGLYLSLFNRYKDIK